MIDLVELVSNRALYLPPRFMDQIPPCSLKHPFENPLTQENRLKHDVCGLYLSARRYIYDNLTKEYYLLMSDGLYCQVEKDDLVREIYDLILVHNPTFDIDLKRVYSAIEQFKNKFNTSFFLKERLEEMNNQNNKDLSDYICDSFDESEDMLIPLNNGIFKPSTGEIIPHCGLFFAPEHYNVDYFPIPEEDIFCDPDLVCDDFLYIFNGDKDTLTYYLHFVGKTLFEKTNLKQFLLFYGVSDSGKTTLVQPLMKIFPSHRREKIEDGSNLYYTHLTASFEGKKFIFCEEMTPKGGSYNADDFATAMKRIVGSDELTINPKGKSHRNIDFNANLILCTNKKPKLAYGDSGFINRCRLMTFDRPITSHFDGRNTNKLFASSRHINWLFNASYHVWKKGIDEKLLVSDAMKKAMDGYLEEDPLYSFLLDKIGAFDNTSVRDWFKKIKDNVVLNNFKTLFDEFRGFTYEEFPDYKPNSRDFKHRLETEYGLRKVNGSGYSYFVLN